MKTLTLALISLAVLAGCQAVPQADFDTCKATLTDSEKQAMFSQTPAGSAGFGTGQAYGNRDIGENL
jgi:hypothetical protein